jgi:TRAP-type mannitol/chloroaromatic compound transport system permease small subunit
MALPATTTTGASSVNALLALSRAIDAVTRVAGRLTLWLVMGAVLISAINAVVRKLFSTSSNAYLEIQWYLFAGVFMLAAGYTLLNNEHVRIDVLTGRLSPRGRTWIDIIGLLLFVLPFCVFVTWLSWPLVIHAIQSGEMSSNEGGLVRWPVFALLPVGLILLGAQAISELIKRIAFLQGKGPDPTLKVAERSAEEELAEAILKLREQEAAGTVAAPPAGGASR